MGLGLPGGEHQVTLRTPAELADALPYLLGYRPDDSIVLVALHDRDRRGRFGGRARLGIPAQAEDWPSASEQLAQGLVKGSERRGARPESMVAYLCQEPASGESGRDVMERLRPLAQLLRTACGRLDVPVIEALCISDGRFWTYTCPGQGCCPAEGTAMGLPGTSVLAAAATYAGLQVRGTLKDLTARFLAWESTAALGQEVALDTASMALVPRILGDASRAEVAEEALALGRRLRDRLAAAPPVSGTRPSDLRDDGLLEDDEAATLILGLQDRTTRDRAAQWMEGDEAAPALRLWRALARRCVGPYREHAAAPLTLAGWVAWSMGDELEAREALAMALGADPDYLFARLLHQACNEGLDPESVRRCLRAQRTGAGPKETERTGPGSSEGGRTGSGSSEAERTGSGASEAERMGSAAIEAECTGSVPSDAACTIPGPRKAERTYSGPGAVESATGPSPSEAEQQTKPGTAPPAGDLASAPASGATATPTDAPADATSAPGAGVPDPASTPAAIAAGRRRRPRMTAAPGSRPGRRGPVSPNLPGRRPPGDGSSGGIRPRRQADRTDRGDGRPRGRGDSGLGAGEGR
ncbi:DUF4192 domain-containing protein [Streptomyces aureus]|uniref:DUF4192 domain-containing protein n=1 Tax=Streptomyces aureus TaxID=193461 RepID=UPI001FD7B807|nr:DUF4192 domain-containing protein [Streptomyces aureus]